MSGSLILISFIKHFFVFFWAFCCNTSIYFEHKRIFHDEHFWTNNSKKTFFNIQYMNRLRRKKEENKNKNSKARIFDKETKWKKYTKFPHDEYLHFYHIYIYLVKKKSIANAIFFKMPNRKKNLLVLSFTSHSRE